MLKVMKRIAQTAGGVLAATVLAILGLALAHRRPAKILPLRIEGRGSAAARDRAEGGNRDSLKAGKWPSELSLMTWNLGYAGMGEEADFFMDGGHDVLAKDKATVVAHLENITDFLQQHPQDIYFLQEVDSDSRRSYYVDEFGGITGALSDYYYSSALNFDVRFLPYPFTQPIGRVRSGLLSLAAYQPAEAARFQLPGSFRWPVSSFNLDRCLLVWRLPREDGKEWVVMNVHLEAWDAGGGLKSQELEFLRNLAIGEYERGNYVIVGGDWNATLPGVRLDQFPSTSKLNQYNMTLPANFLPSGWRWGVDASRPSNRRSDAPYRPGENYVTVIDGFVVSPNVQILSVNTLALGFRDSDHEPVVMRVVSR
ncbi:MAG: endonuclease/exonuclease/phosphatase family protein [Candidatus Acidiferrales bacterium]|jgi:endonuclease/exonuclease/phosphatase family metal-dependent hydrolase